MTALTDSHIFVGNSSNVATDVAMSGDATIDDTGAVTVSIGLNKLIDVTYQTGGSPSNLIIGQKVTLASGATGNVFIGEIAGATAANSTSDTQNNTAVGYGTMRSLAGGQYNTAAGGNALYGITSGGQNCAFGYESMQVNSSGSQNCAFGYTSLRSGNGDANSAFGISALFSINGGDYNCAFGGEALPYSATGSQNIGIGYLCGQTLTSGSTNILIGYEVDVPTASTSNYLNIGGAITGDMTTGPALMNGFTATTQSAGDNSTKIATTAYANAAVRIRSTSITSSSTPTPNTDTTDDYVLTALAAAPTFGAPTGSPVDGQRLCIRIKDNGTARALAWNAAYRGGGDVALPTTTVISKTMYVGFMYNSADSKWDCVASIGNI